MKIVLLILLGVFILYVIVINSLNTPKRIKEREATRKRRDELYKKFLEQERKRMMNFLLLRLILRQLQQKDIVRVNWE